MASELLEIAPFTPQRHTFGDAEFTANADGSEMLSLFGPADENTLAGFSSDFAPEDFNTNLAESLSQSERHALAERLIEYHRVDLSSRERWEDMTRQALVLLGVEKIDQARLPFAGAASMQHPVIAEACTQFNANAIEEFFPATGPVKGKLAGEAMPETEAQVERAQDYMNYYLTTEDRGYYADSDQMLFYLPIAGSVFRKVWVDPRSGQPRARYVKAEDFVAPYFARDLENCPRYCHQYQMTGAEVRRGMRTGEFLELDLPTPPLEAEESAGIKVEDRSDRRTRVLHEDDELFDVLEYHVEMNLKEGVDAYDRGEFELPYIITVDATSRDILAIRRNWKEVDPKFTKRVWFTHYKFLPGLGFYGWGFLHVIGSLAEAVGGSARALLDSALMATMQGGFRGKDGAKKGGFVQVEPGKWKDVDATIDELQKTFFNPPFKEPSPALHQLMTSLVADARRFASLTEVLVGQADNKAPVGTTLALIEQSMKLFTAIHKRIFNAAQHEFSMLAELIHDYGPDETYPYFLEGEAREALRTDFDDRVDFIPVADPNIISDVQRIALAQAQVELVASDPALYGPEQRVEAHKRFLRALKVPNPEAIEPKLPKATYLDPIGENMQILMGRPVKAFPGQNHDAHIFIHRQGVEVAKNSMPPDQFLPLYNIFMAHIREHEALKMYEAVSRSMQTASGVPMPPIDLYTSEQQDMPPELEMAISLLAAQNLPPPPPPAPGSAGEAQAQGPAQIAQEREAESAADIKAKEAETAAKIERETQAFAVKQQQDKEAHAQKLRQQAEEHAMRMRQMDEQAAADIIRKHAQARAQRRHEQLAGVSKLALEVRRDREKAKAQKSALAGKPKRKANGSTH